MYHISLLQIYFSYTQCFEWNEKNTWYLDVVWFGHAFDKLHQWILLDPTTESHVLLLHTIAVTVALAMKKSN